MNTLGRGSCAVNSKISPLGEDMGRLSAEIEGLEKIATELDQRLAMFMGPRSSMEADKLSEKPGSRFLEELETKMSRIRMVRLQLEDILRSLVI